MGLLDAATDPRLLIARIIAFIVAISAHEACHALAATWLGDLTPKSQGRLTLNPLRHLDPMGTLLLVIVGFGWGKPVVVNPLHLRFGMRRGMAIVAAAGPCSNLAMAALLGPVFRQVAGDTSGILPSSTFLAEVVLAVIWINILLAIFNLIPIPPLDGFGVLNGIVGPETAEALAPLRRYGPLILMGLIFLGPLFGIPVLQRLIFPPMVYLFNLFVGS